MDRGYDKKIESLIESYRTWFKDESILQRGRMSGNLYPYQKLFEPIWINRLKIKNRIVMAPMGNIGMADETGKPSSKMIEYFIERARGGTGLLISGMIPVDWKEDPSYEDLHNTGIFPRIDSHRGAYSGWREMVEGCHAYGAKFFIQLAPGMGRVGNPECLIKKKKLPVSSSWNPNWYIPEIPCRPLSDRGIKRIIKKTAMIARDAKELGVDGVCLHGHSGYLIEQMTDTAYNRRKFGTFSKWQEFGIRMVKAIREKCGRDFPIQYRIDITSGIKEIYEDIIADNKVLKKFKRGRTPEMTLEYMKELAEAGVDVFDVDIGAYENWWLPHPPNAMPPGLYLEVSKIVMDYFKEKGIKSASGGEIPVIGVGKLGVPDLAEGALREGKCNMIMLGRPLLADPYWPQKVYEGKIKEIRPCIGDHEGCLGQIAIGGHPHCTVNPRTSFEYRYDIENRASKGKKIAVVGAGPGGIVFAKRAAERGHKIHIFESRDIIGGNLNPGSIPKIKYELRNYVDYLGRQLELLEKNYDVKLSIGKKADISVLREGAYDVIVTATGTKPFIPKIPGWNRKNVVIGTDFLREPHLDEDVKRVIVIGGADVGCEVAHMVSYELGRDVTVVEMTPYFMRTTCTSNRNNLIYSLKKNGVTLKNCTGVTEIKENGVRVKRNISKGVPDPYVTWLPILPENVENPFQKKLCEKFIDEDIQGDIIIMCTGAKANDDIYYRCVKERVAPEIYNIGDSIKPGRVLEATKSAYALADSI